ncbi:MAG TPA: hypothetical protein VNE62_04275 [Actinomycetota bacterium]|nr:hypothetical protein [Actinomycetota bacterium]
MRVTFAGSLSMQIEDEWLYDGRAVPVVLKAEIDEDVISFEDGRARLRLDLPIDLKISEQEWSRAVGEVLARYFKTAKIS